MIQSENNPERLIKTTPILKSIENQDVKTVPGTGKKKKKRVSSVYNGYLILSLDHF